MAAPLSREEVQRLVGELSPGMGEQPLRPVDEGGEHATWWVGTEYVLRMAPDAEATVRLRREIAVRDAVRPVLDLPVPRSAASGEWAPGCGCTLDVRLAGVSAEHRAVSEAGEKDLARLLGGLAGFPAAEAAALGVPAERPRHLSVLKSGAGRAARTLADDGEFDLTLLRRLETGPTPLATEDVPEALVHFDLKGEHLLTDEAGRVTGVLDWTDAVLGDPAEDIAGLALSIGATAAFRIARLSGHSPALASRGLRLARCDTALRLADRLHGTDDSPLPLLRHQLARAWQPASPA